MQIVATAVIIINGANNNNQSFWNPVRSRIEPSNLQPLIYCIAKESYEVATVIVSSVFTREKLKDRD